MAQRTNITSERTSASGGPGRINDLDRSVRGVFADAEEWDEFSEIEQIDYSLEWDNDMSGVESLEKAYRNNELTDEQAARYEDLRANLKRTLPVLERLQLSKPSVSLDR